MSATTDGALRVVAGGPVAAVEDGGELLGISAVLLYAVRLARLGPRAPEPGLRA